MDPQLVGPPRAGRQLHQGEPVPPRQDPVGGLRRLARRVYPPPDGGGRVPPDGQIDPPRVLRRAARADGQVGPPEGPGVEPLPQEVVDVGVLRRRHDPGGPPVQPVDQMEGRALPQIVQQSGGQGGLSGDQGGRDAGQGRGFVHHQQVLILEKDVQRHGGGLHTGGPLCRVQVHRQAVPLPEDGAGEDPGPVDGEAGLGPLQPAHESGGHAQLPPQQALHRPPRLLPGHYKLQSRHTRLPSPRYGSSIQYPLLIFNRDSVGK